MSAEQYNIEKIKNMTRRSIKTSSFIMWPLMIGLIVTAEPIVKLILTDKWISCVPFLQIFCLTYVLWLIHTANLSAIKAIGRSDLFLMLEIIKKAVGIIVLLLIMHLGILIMAYSLLFTNVLSSFINSYPNKKLLNYSYLDQIKDILPSMLLSIIMGCMVYPIQYLNLNIFPLLIIQVILGGAIYMLCAGVLHFKSFEYIVYIIKRILKK